VAVENIHWTTTTIRVPEMHFLSLNQVSAAIGFSPKQIRTMIKNGKFPQGKRIEFHKNKRWSALTVAAFLLWMEVGPERPPAPDDEPPDAVEEVDPPVNRNDPEKSRVKRG